MTAGEDNFHDQIRTPGFVCSGNALSKIDGDFDLISVGDAIDAKSIKGIFSLDLSKSLKEVEKYTI